MLVRLALVPLFVKQMKSSQQMQAIAPKIKALQAKHKGDRKKLQEEQMKLYQEHSVNPFGACLPLVFQMPVFFALYLVLRTFSKHPPGGQAGRRPRRLRIPRQLHPQHHAARPTRSASRASC